MSTVDDAPTQQVELAIGGMTCASCAARIEKQAQQDGRRHRHRQLRDREGHGRFPADLAAGALIDTVEATGYHAAAAPPPAEPGAAAAPAPTAEDDEVRALRQRLLVSAVLTRAGRRAGDDPGLQFDNWQWLSLTLAAPGRRLGRAGRSTGRPGSTCGTAPPRWTP